ncbi:MAG: TolC family protein [Deltaproteobacteria bacterium]|nr:TolC family protein [Deltaproteobacteria bacterium]
MKENNISRYQALFVAACISTIIVTAGTGSASQEARKDREGIQGMSLNDCLKYALEHSPALDAEHAGVEAMEAKRLQAVWSWIPRISISSILAGPTSKAELAYDPVTRSRDPSKTGSVALDQASGDGELNYGEEVGVMWRFGIQAVMPIYTFGKISSLKKAAEKGLEAAIDSEAMKKQKLKRDIRKTFFAYQAAREILAVLKDGSRKLDQAEQKVSDSLDEDEDTYSETDLFKIRVYGAEVKARVAETKKMVAMAEEGMKFLLGWPGRQQLVLEHEDLSEEKEVLQDLDTLLGLARKENPIAKAVTCGLAAKTQIVSNRTANFFPDLYLAGGFNYSVDTAAQDLHNPFLYDNRNFKSAGAFIGLKWNIDFPMLIGRLKEAQAELKKTEAARKIALEGLSLKVKEGYLETKRAAAALVAYKKARKAGRSWLVSATLNWGVGTLEADDFIDAIKAYSVAEIAYTKALLEYHDSLADLLFRVGVEKGIRADNRGKQK